MLTDIVELARSSRVLCLNLVNCRSELNKFSLALGLDIRKPTMVSYHDVGPWDSGATCVLSMLPLFEESLIIVLLTTFLLSDSGDCALGLSLVVLVGEV